MERNGLIDIGSNTIRLVIFQYDERTGLNEIQNIKTPARLSQYLDDDQNMTQEGIDVLTTALRSFKKVADKFKVKHLYPIATAAIRQSKNQPQILKSIQKELGITTLYVTHDQEEALTLSDRIAVFNNGYIEQVGTPVEIYHNSQTEFVCDFIGDINVLTDETVHEVLLKNASVFLEDKKGYIRLEKVRFNRETEQDFTLKGTIIDVEFSGVTIHYTIKVSESQILNVTSIDSQAAIRSVGESVDLFITPSDVLQF